MNNKVAVVVPSVYASARKALKEYATTLGTMASNVSRADPGNWLIKDLLDMQRTVLTIMEGFDSSVVSDEKTIRNLLDTIYSSDEESALEMFQIDPEYDKFEPKKEIH